MCKKRKCPNETQVRKDLANVRAELLELEKENDNRRGSCAHPSVEQRFSRKIELKRIHEIFLTQELNYLLLERATKNSSKTAWLATFSTVILAIIAIINLIITIVTQKP